MRLLLDAHVSPAVARALQESGIDALALRDWQGGRFRNASDAQILVTAATEERVLVTYDLRSIPPLLKEWAESGRVHAGVILVDGRTIRPGDVGGPRRALAAAVAERWRDRVVFLRAR
jgi:hypothetical protein